MKAIIDDLTGWLGLSRKQLEEVVIVIAGDQMIADRMRRAKRYLQGDVDSSVYKTRGFVLTLVGWWQQKCAAQEAGPLISLWP